ncbi:major facilitator superfamily domain-containing protein [Piptocephalis cylindrospora]|uniref:Major facilitator superfamily domain-containing protein n=1 Tax=Piptocephalis cylindrospora TaxID=1907219 RepID=A0A4P9Y4R7_9FUNG|nr:major facilitator superfamily domain-containing protein [Piptocephalis cylindrospora]|eukprot:RKP13883.1 major facilitator superfamily domain-containing protein [Piptocephalis cylindrospora]
MAFPSPLTTIDTVTFEKDGTVSEVEPPPYPEGGFGWVVVVACFFIHFAFYGFIQAWGVYQSAYANTVFPGQISPTVLSLVGTLQPGLRNLLAVVTGVMATIFGFRLMILIGTILSCLGLLLASFVTNPFLLIPTQGILVGIGGALIFTPILSAPSHWFLKRRGLVAGAAISGSGIGGLMWAPLTEKLISGLGIPWSLRIQAIILFVVGIITSFLVQPRLPMVRDSLFSRDTLKGTRKPAFVFLSIVIFMFFLADFIPLFLISAFAIENGATPADGAVAVALINATQAIARLVFGSMADWIGCANALIISMFMSSLVCFVIWIPATTYPVLLVFACTFGLFSGGAMTVAVAIIPEIYGE